MSDMAKKPKTGAVFSGQMMLFDKLMEGSSSLFAWPSEPNMWVVRDVPSGQAILRQGGAPECLFEIVSGTVKLSQVTEDGQQIVLGFPSSGDLVGLTGGKEYRYAAETLTITRMRVTHWKTFYRQLLRDPSALEKLLGWINAQEKMMNEHIAVLALPSPLTRLAAFLIRQISQQKGGPAADCATVDLPMTQRDIATYLGIAPETCSRTMKKLREDNIIATRDRSGAGQVLKILDRNRLNACANISSP